jgi:hypothetical protein
MHNWASHGSDAFRYMAIALKEPKKDVRNFQTIPRRPLNVGRSIGGSWM